MRIIVETASRVTSAQEARLWRRHDELQNRTIVHAGCVEAATEGAQALKTCLRKRRTTANTRQGVDVWHGRRLLPYPARGGVHSSRLPSRRRLTQSQVVGQGGTSEQREAIGTSDRHTARLLSSHTQPLDRPPR